MKLPRASANVRACLLAAALVVFGAAPSLARATLPNGFQDTVAIGGLDLPTAVRFAPDGKVFVAEKSGKILVYDSLSDSTPTLFADLRTEVYNANDRGLLGLAIDPQFPTRPYVYVLYSYDAPPGKEAPFWGNPGEDGDNCPDPPGADTDGCVIQGRLSRLTADLATDTSTEETPIITDWCQQFSSHSIGDLQFDSSGSLWASGGEGASFTSADYGQYGSPNVNPCGDPPAGIGGTEAPPTAMGGALRAQNPQNLDGSIIRVDPDTGEGLPTNPMATSLDANERRIVAYGFRNPFRFAIDPTTNDVYVDNVGSSVYEEIDRFTPSSTSAFNSGWPCYEGPAKQGLYESLGLTACENLYNSPGSTSPPYFSYSHVAGVSSGDPCPYDFGSAISGLAFYEGGSYPTAYDGALFFADSVRGCIYVMRTGNDGSPDPSTVAPFLTDGGLYPGVDIEVGPGGDLYYVSLFGDGYGPGAVHRISHDPVKPQASLKADKYWGTVPLDVQFDAGDSTDPQGDPLQYEWDLDGDGTFTAPTSSSTATETYTDGSANRIAAVRVVDPDGNTSDATVTVYPGDTPPVPDIAEPADTLKWSVGQQIAFAGSATDTEDGGLLPDSGLYWRSRLYHCPSSCHAHPLQSFAGVSSGTLTAPDHDLPSHIELTLTATDSRGLDASKTVAVYPNTTTLDLDSDPPGVNLTTGLQTGPAPFTYGAIEGSKVTISAPQTADVGGTTYTWADWSDGGTRAHTIIANGPRTYVAHYAGPTPSPNGRPGGSTVTSRPVLRKKPQKTTRSSTAVFKFSARGAVRFKCKLDGKPFRSCHSPLVFRRLGPGWHTFKVVAEGSGGVRSAPTTFRWKVV